MKKTIKMAALREPHNYWIQRRVYQDENGKEYIKLNGIFYGLDWFYIHGWDVDIAF